MEEIIVKPYDWRTHNVNNITETHCWSLNKNSETCLVRFRFPVFVYLELPIFHERKLIKWTPNDTIPIQDNINNYMSKSGLTPLGITFTRNPKLYYYKGNSKNSFLFIRFDNLSAISKLRTYLNKGITTSEYKNLKLTIRESEFSLPRKLTTLKNLGFTQWFKCNAIKLSDEETLSRLDNEYFAEWDKITPIPIEETMGWEINPGILSFDIECYSDNKMGMPKRENPKHFVFQISIVYQKLLRPKTKKKISFVYGNYLPNLENVEKIVAQDELQLLVKFSEKIKELKPNIIIGFNTFNWDWPYLNARMKLHNKTWDSIGFLKDETPELTSLEWQSESYGENKIYYLDMAGIVNIDLYKYVKRVFNLQRNNLDFVGEYFLGRNKLPVSHLQMFKTVEFFWISVAENKSIDEAFEKMREVAMYNVEDSNLVYDLFEELNIWYSLNELSDISGVPMIELYSRGLQVRIASNIYNEANKRGIVIDSIGKPEEKPLGGFVKDPDSGLYENVIILDFRSLYPTICSQFNIDFTTLLQSNNYQAIDEENTNNFAWEDEIKNKKGDVVGKDKHMTRFMKEPLGVVPQILTTFINDRIKLKEQLKHEINGTARKILSARQEALKLTANAVIGALGSENSKLSLIDAAKTVTSIGRETIKSVIDYVGTLGYDVIYADTDSIMVNSKLNDVIQVYELAEELENKINERFKPLTIEFENAGKMLLLKKKKYIFWPKDINGCKLSEDNIIYKGITLAQKSASKWQRRIYKNVLINILNNCPFEKTYKIVIREICDMLSGQVNNEDLIMVNDVGKDYKSQTAFMLIFAEKLRDKGKIINAGDQLEYLIVKKIDEPKKSLLGYKMRLPEDFNEDIGETIDYEYYLEHKLQNCIDLLFEIGYNNINIENKHVSNANLPLSYTPIKYIVSLLRKKQVTIEVLKQICEN